MPPKRIRTYSRHSQEAVAFLGRLIRLHRIESKMTGQNLADRAGISRRTLHKIEQGEMGSEIGLAFEVAVLVGVPLFSTDALEVSAARRLVDDKMALLPKAVHAHQKPLKDDF